MAVVGTIQGASCMVAAGSSFGMTDAKAARDLDTAAIAGLTAYPVRVLRASWNTAASSAKQPVDDPQEIATRGGSAKAENMAMVGVATPYLPFSIDDFTPFVHELFDRKGERVVAANLAVLSIVYRVGAFYKALLEAGVPSASVSRLLDRTQVETVEPALAGRFAQLLVRGAPEPGPRVPLESFLAG